MNHRRLAALCLAAVAWYGAGLDAIFVLPETRKVPVARLVANLEKELAAGPATADQHLWLARLYGMAYALNADEVPVAVRPSEAGKEQQAEEIWLGPSPHLVPRQLAPEKTRTATSLVYSYVLNDGRKLIPGDYLFAAQFAHKAGRTNTDSYTVVARTADTGAQLSGHFIR